MASYIIPRELSTIELDGLGLTLNGNLLGSSFWKLDRIRVLIISAIGNTSANTVYNVGTVPSGDRPVLQACATFTSVVSGAITGYGRISVDTNGTVQLVSSFSGNQEIMVAMTWIAEE